MSAAVAIVDYGVGNLFSVARALEHCGATVSMAGDAASILAAPRLILPGVGAFANGMQELASRGLEAPIRDYCASGRPFFGICLGMQLMFDRSEEFGDWPGLGLLPGVVRAIPPVGTDGVPHKVPHIGWNGLRAGSADWSGSVLDGVAQGSTVYFVHSYAVHPADPSHRVADADYDGQAICAVVRRGNLHGCQFHPERSGETGLAIVRNFLRLPS